MGRPRSEEQAWRQLAAELGAEFLEDERGDVIKVVLRVKQWSITLHRGKGVAHQYGVSHPRMIAAPYVSKDGFQFEVYRKAPLGHFWEKLFGTKDLEVECPESRRGFFIKGDSEAKVEALSLNPRIAELIESQPPISIKVLRAARTAYFAEEVHALYADLGWQFIMDVDRLKSLFQLFAEILDRLCEIGSAFEEEPDLEAVRARLWELRDI